MAELAPQFSRTRRRRPLNRGVPTPTAAIRSNRGSRRLRGTTAGPFLIAAGALLAGWHQRRKWRQAEGLRQEAKRIEEALRASEELNRRTLQALPAHIAVVSASGRILVINEAWTEFAAANGADDSPTIRVGANYLEVCRRAINRGEPDATRALAGIEAVLAGREPQFTMEYPCHSPQQQRWFQMTVVPLGKDGNSGAVITHLNITARRQAEATLQVSEERLRLSAAATGVGIFDFDPIGGHLVWTEPARQHFGLARGAAVDYGVFLRGLHPDDRDRVDGIVRAALRGEAQGRYHTQYRTIGLDDGMERWIDARGQVLFDAHGRAVRFIGTTLDITEHQRLQEELRHWAATLEQRVAQRTAELTVSNRELEAFTYTVAHDLRAPLRHVLSFLEVLRRSLAGKLDPANMAVMHRILEAARRMQRLIDDLLEFSRLARMGIERRPVGLARLLDEVRQLLSPETDGRQVDWRIGSLPVVEADARLLRQVFYNLLHNALKFTRPRPIAIIEVNAQEHPHEWLVQVRDNGVGFDMQYASKLFGVFQRLHDQRDFEGTGIGLAHVQRIIQRHGGRVWAQSQPEQGTSVFFSLPKPVEKRE